MTGKALDRFTTSRSSEPHLASVMGQDQSDTQDLGYFGILRGPHERAVMLELRKQDGSIKAIGYAWLESAEFDPSIGITLYAAGLQITIAGRNLNREIRPHLRLFESLTRHRLAWLREATEGEAMAAPESATIVESIVWKPARR